MGSWQILQTVLVHGTDGGVFLDQTALDHWLRADLDQTVHILVAEQSMFTGRAGGREHALAWMGAGQPDDALDQPDGANTARSDGFVGPSAQIGADPLASGQQVLGIRLLRVPFGRCAAGTCGELTGGNARVYSNLDQTVRDAHEVTIPPHLHAAPQQSQRTLPHGTDVTHVNLNDGTCEGFFDASRQLLAVQYHPESSPGPHDALGLFGEFRRLVDREGSGSAADKGAR